jgi:hypothetical protein
VCGARGIEQRRSLVGRHLAGHRLSKLEREGQCGRHSLATDERLETDHEGSLLLGDEAAERGAAPLRALERVLEHAGLGAFAEQEPLEQTFREALDADGRVRVEPGKPLRYGERVAKTTELVHETVLLALNAAVDASLGALSHRGRALFAALGDALDE